MRHNPYERFVTEELVLSDQLAIDRTILANERTFLAYCRTALALFLTGAGCIKFVESVASNVAGWVLIVMGLVVIVIGMKRSAMIARDLADVEDEWMRPQS